MYYTVANNNGSMRIYTYRPIYQVHALSIILTGLSLIYLKWLLVYIYIEIFIYII